jgi:thioester reductase-like protein
LRVFPLSARSEDQLRTAALRLRDYVAASGDDERDIAHTLCYGRKSFEFRLAVMASTRAELAARLDDFIEGRAGEDVLVGHIRNAEPLTGLLNAREKQDFVGLLVRSADPRRLGRLWSDGVIAEWKGIGLAEDGKRIGLPTYPFNRDRYWIGESTSEPAHAAVAPVPQRAAPARIMERYEFPMVSDHHALSGQLLHLDVAEKSRLFTGQLLADQLGVAIGQIAYDVQLMDTGLTSMDMAEMTQAIKLALDPAFSPTAFFECTTIASLGDLLAANYPAELAKMAVTRRSVEDIRAPAVHTDAAARGILMHVVDAQSALPLPAAPLPAIGQEPMRCVLLTGATGFLGVHLLAELLSAVGATRVLCLVRAADRQHGLQRIAGQAAKYQLTLDTSRITVMCGDVNAPRLGLSDADWAHCVHEVQQIVHASAHVNHIEGYATFRASTLGMKEIIRLAGSERPKLIQFISSIAGCARKVGDAFSIFEHEDFLEDGEHVYGGYGQSKWVQETYLKQAGAHGIPYVIYRFGELSGSSVTGLGQSDDMLHRLLQMRLAIGCREKISNDVLDMLPVDFAASLVARTGAAPPLWNRIVHATHLKPYSFAQLYRQAAQKGLESTPVAREQFLARCYEFIEYVYSVNSVNGFVLECVMRDVEGSIKQRKMMDSYFAVLFPFAQDNFQQALKALELRMPDWNALIVRYFSAWEQEESGFMHTIHAYRAWRDSDGRARVATGGHSDIPGEAKIIELFLEGERQ